MIIGELLIYYMYTHFTYIQLCQQAMVKHNFFMMHKSENIKKQPLLSLL